MPYTKKNPQIDPGCGGGATQAVMPRELLEILADDNKWATAPSRAGAGLTFLR
jgi:prepilin-type N-terminal cleavage/methylation domain-containing protein